VPGKPDAPEDKGRGDAGSKSARTRQRLLRPDLDPMAARVLVLGALNWAAEWWNPRRVSLDAVPAMPIPGIPQRSQLSQTCAARRIV
jgi:hypothetical protein